MTASTNSLRVHRTVGWCQAVAGLPIFVLWIFRAPAHSGARRRHPMTGQYAWLIGGSGMGRGPDGGAIRAD
jgi:hypothetical protein